MIEIHELHTGQPHKLIRVRGPGGPPNNSAWQIQSQPSKSYFLREVWPCPCSLLVGEVHLLPLQPAFP